MNLIVLSKVYPRKTFIYSGTYVNEQVEVLKKLINGNITVISPIPWSPKLLWFNKKWRAYGKTEKEKYDNGVQVYYRRYLAIPGSIFTPLHVFFMYLSIRYLIKAIIKKNKSSTILHSHAIYPDGLVGGLIGRKYNILHICTVHGSDINILPSTNRLNLFMVKYAIKNCDYIVAVSNAIKEKINSIMKCTNNISVINNGANPEKFKIISKDIAKKRLGIDSNDRIILFVGNLKAVKGVSSLIGAFSEYIKKNGSHRVSLYLIGDGNERQYLEKLINDLKLVKNVFFMGGKSHDEIPLWLSAADLFVLPSRSEGFPTVIPEAMMCGTPVIATEVGGVPEIITDGKTGMLVKPGDIEQLANSINTVMDNEAIKNRLVNNAIELSKGYTWDNNAIQYMRIYKKLLKKVFQ